jgi:large subunit ribosomal protein L17
VDGSHRKSLLRNLLTSLVDHERLETTHVRCKVLKREFDKLVTTAKKGTLHHKRLVASVLFRKDMVTKLFEELAPRYADRHGGYSRIIPRGRRRGDAAEVSIIELLGSEAKTAAAAAPKEKAEGEDKEKKAE